MALRLTAILLGVLLASAAAAAPPPVHYLIDAELDPAARTIRGTVEIRYQHGGTRPLEDLALVLYPNRFAREDDGINDFNRPFVYPREVFVLGGVTIEAIELGAAAAPFSRLDDVRLEAAGEWPDTLLRARMPSPLQPGGSAVLRVRFRTVLPERYGPFGIAAGRVTALGGWFPTLAARVGDRWEPGASAPVERVAGTLHVPPSLTVAIGNQVTPAGHAGVVTFGLENAPPILLASADYRGAHRKIDALTVLLLELPPPRAFAFPPRRPHAETMLDTVERILRERPAGVPLPAEPLLVAEAPLRLELTAPGGPYVAVVSDRTLRVHRLLREFHERELAARVYAALLRRAVAARESPVDAPWVLEGVAAELADRYLAAVHPRHRTVYDWVGLFDVFAIVDRFESAPKIPFADAFFPDARHADELRDGFESFARDRPPGRTIFTKLRNAIGTREYAATIERYLAGREPFRRAAAVEHRESLDWLFEQWTQSYPRLNYALDAELNGGAPSDGAAAADAAVPTSAAGVIPGSAAGRGDALAAAYRHRLSIARTSSRPIRETVEVEVRGRGDALERRTVDTGAPHTLLEIETPWRARRAEIDPDRHLLEETRVDNTRPPRLQVVLDSADVTVTSSEFGISGLFVARQRYDYRKDVGLIADFSDRSVGMHLGPRLHFGPPNDPTSYRHNLYGFYTLAALRGDFGDDSRPGFHTDGRLGGLGLRYDYTDEFAYDNPTSTNKLRLFGDWYSSALGSSFDYVTGGMRASVVRPLVTPRTLVALQVMNAFSGPTGGDHVPNQGRYSLGGDLAVRGIPVDERLGENLALVRAELRQTLAPEVDHNLFDLVVVRRPQLRLFVDAGRVEDRRSSLYRLSDFAVGVGLGAAMIYDFMGFYPAVAYVAVAQRVDRFAGVDNRVQFLFGTRQAF